MTARGERKVTTLNPVRPTRQGPGHFDLHAGLYEAGWRWCATGKRWYRYAGDPAKERACLCGMPCPPAVRP